MSDVKWQEILENNGADVNHNKFIETFDALYNECVPLKKCPNNRTTGKKNPWITKGLLKVLIPRTSCISNIFILQAEKDFRNLQRTKLN